MGRYQNNQLKATVSALATSHSREVETSAGNPGIVQVEVKEAWYDCRRCCLFMMFLHAFCFFAFDAGRRLRQKTQRTTHAGHCRATYSSNPAKARKHSQLVVRISLFFTAVCLTCRTAKAATEEHLASLSGRAEPICARSRKRKPVAEHHLRKQQPAHMHAQSAQ